uniref:Uncharacterized protein n=1 Tax=Avena sativa TaxID=4498 RepID=A0ACD5YPU7_AVESA
MDYWKSKVLPKMKTVFAKSASKKDASAAELVKAFNESRDGINGEFEEKKADLQPKVVEIYESATAAVKVLIKEKKGSSWIKKNSAGVTKLIQDLANIDFPGAKQVSEGIAKVGPALLSGPLFVTFDKVTTLLPGSDETSMEAPAAAEKEAAAVEEKKEGASEEKEGAAEEKKEEVETQVAVAEEAVPVAAEPAKEEAAAPSEPEPAKAQEETPKA